MGILIILLQAMVGEIVEKKFESRSPRVDFSDQADLGGEKRPS
jgi:hypothetical protein